MKTYENFDIIDESSLSIVHSKKENLFFSQDIKSLESITQINKLYDALNTLEKKHSNQIAEKYLIGFLEEKGFVTFDEFTNSLS